MFFLKGILKSLPFFDIFRLYPDLLRLGKTPSRQCTNSPHIDCTDQKLEFLNLKPEFTQVKILSSSKKRMHSSTSRSSSTTRCSTDKIPTTSNTSRDKSSASRSTLNSSDPNPISNQNSSPPTTPKLQQKRASLDFSRSETQATQTVQFDDTSALATLAAYENQILTSGLSLENPENSEIDSSSSPFKKVGSGIKLDRRSTKSIDEELDEEDEKNDKSLRWTMTQEELLEEERIEELVKSRRNRDPRLVIFDVSSSRVRLFRLLCSTSFQSLTYLLKVFPN